MTLKDLVKNRFHWRQALYVLTGDGGVLAPLFSCLARLRTEVVESMPCRLLSEYKRQISIFLHVLWLVGCGLWAYEFMTLKVQPRENAGLVLSDSRDALVILFFGIMAAGFVIFAAFFVVKLIYNLFHEGMESLFPAKWHTIVRPVSYLTLLYFAFSFTGPIKVAGLTAYNQVAAIVQTSQQRDIIIRKEIPEDFERKLNELIRLIDGSDEE